MKIIPFKKRTKHKGFENPFYERVEYYQEQLLDKESMMEFLAMLAADVISERGWDTDEFCLNNHYALLFMEGDMYYLMKELGSEVSLVFQKVTENEIICVAPEARMDEHEEIFGFIRIYRLEGYREGNRKWELIQDDYWGDHGEDYDLEYILKNEDLDWINCKMLGMMEETEI